jgi:hypothetical protein
MIMNLRFGAYVVAALFLAACGQVFSNNHPSSLLPTSTAERGQPLLVPAAKATPAYSLAIVLPDRAVRGNYLDRNVGSVKATTYVAGRKKPYIKVIEAPPGCPEDGSTHKVSGCEVLYAASTELKIRATFVVYKAAKAKGCILAKASFKGEAAYGSPVASTFKAENTKTCWK